MVMNEVLLRLTDMSTASWEAMFGPYRKPFKGMLCIFMFYLQDGLTTV